MKFKIIRICLFLLLLSVPLSVLGSDYIGYRHEGVRFGEKLPNGVQDLGGGLISDEDYGVTRFRKGDVYMLWLERIISRNKAGVPRWEVLDVLSFKGLKRNRQFLFSYSSPCRLSGKENLDLIVLAETSSRTKKSMPVKAWMADINTGKFKAISITGIACR